MFVKDPVKDFEEVGNPAYSLPHVGFCDITNISPLQNKFKVVGSGLMDPNDPSRINIASTGKK